MKALVYELNPARWMLCRALGLLGPSVYWSALSNLHYRDMPPPRLPGPGWVRLRTILGGICGTDLSLILQKAHPGTILRAFASYPLVLGHENVARIAEVGEQVPGWKPGQRVVVEPALSCEPRGIDPPCRLCRAGLFALCESTVGNERLPAGTMVGLNNFTGGSWAEEFVAHHGQLHALPDDLPDEAAVLIDPLACSLHGVLRCPPPPEAQVIIQGGGIIGLGVMLGLRALGYANPVTAVVRRPDQAELLCRAGARPLVVPRKAPRRALFEQLVAVLGGRRVAGAFGNQAWLGGVDVVYECVGTGRSLGDALKMCRPRGTVVALGTSQITILDSTPLWFGERSIVGSYGRQIEDVDGRRIHTYALTIELIRTGKLNLEGLTPRVFPAAQYRQALGLAAGRSRERALKVALRPG